MLFNPLSYLNTLKSWCNLPLWLIFWQDTAMQISNQPFAERFHYMEHTLFRLVQKLGHICWEKCPKIKGPKFRLGVVVKFTWSSNVSAPNNVGSASTGCMESILYWSTLSYRYRITAFCCNVLCWIRMWLTIWRGVYVCLRRSAGQPHVIQWWLGFKTLSFQIVLLMISSHFSGLLPPLSSVHKLNHIVIITTRKSNSISG